MNILKKILTISFAVLVLFSISGLSFVSANGIEQTREQCIDFIISNSTIDYSLQETSVLDDFVDATSVTNDFTLKKVSAAVDKGILKGYEDKTLRLDEKVTRAEFACMIYRAKDYYMPCTDIVTYKGNYTDLADWNQNEIIYCIENGFLMGYGNKFGSEDYITAEQMSIVGTRLKYGLSTREKYSLMNVCGVCPIPFDTMIASAYDDEIINYDLKTSGLQEDTSVSKETTTAKLIDMLDMLGNLDCDKLKNVEYETYQKKDFLFRIPSPPCSNGSRNRVDYIER